MASVKFEQIFKVYNNGYSAVQNFSLKIEDGEFLVLVGPSGCGKSTILRILAGLETISAGKLMIDGEVINEKSPQQRNIAMVFQNYALYPHLTVRQNLEFPLRMMKLPPQKRREQVKMAAYKLGLLELLENKPKQLSGGERQRVAMGRAMVRNPSVFLMDEPLSNLDAKMRVQIRSEIVQLQQQTQKTTVYVTHDQVEAMTMGTRVAVLRSGKLQQVATPQELYHHPANVFVASFIGSPSMNIFLTQLQKREDGTFFLKWGSQYFPIPVNILDKYPKIEKDVNRPIFAGLRPEAFFVAENHSSHHPSFAIEVETLESLGHETLIYFHAPVFKLEIEENYPDLATLDNSLSTPFNSILIARLTSFYPSLNLEKLTLAMDLNQLYLFPRET